MVKYILRGLVQSVIIVLIVNSWRLDEGGYSSTVSVFNLMVKKHGLWVKTRIGDSKEVIER